MVEEGFAYFEKMTKEYGIEPIIEHYACTLYLARYSPRLKEALELLQKMPLKPNKLIWSMLYLAAPPFTTMLQIAWNELRKLEAAENSWAPRYDATNYLKATLEIRSYGRQHSVLILT